MAKNIIRVFATRSAAEDAVRDLRKAGYTDNQISLIGKDSQGHTVNQDGAGTDVTTKRVSEGAALGAATGAAGGALVTLGLLTGVIPVLGPVVALGALGTTLLNAAGGAAAVGLAGALTGWGVAETDAKYFEDEVKNGRFIVAVEADANEPNAHKVFTQHRGYDRTTAPVSTF
ncbi:hypothetical protein [Limnoglobus roseus]|uniref:General stress protein 17M-like domain-containing protein n=1 Tax=Limnoglobus roseus TaxID=2598579 RepID=A0A5C1ALC7_9BACT|nr:hypothetical protein [Limnoglobus roseus]QEL19750.1 hypothetical protein PX52LOC_06829 [Limnoglobus roseus]